MLTIVCFTRFLGPAAIEYQRRQPEQTLLHEVVRENLESFLASAHSQGMPVARFVEREVRAYLTCGVLAHGFLRLHCDACGHDRLLAFSCKGRGFCPSCGGRRMADTAAHLVDRVLPEVPVRQWVLTLPYPLRYRCAWDARLMSAVLRAFMRSLSADLRRRARLHHDVRGGQFGSVTFIQRFGSALNLTPHFHSLVLDGVYAGPAYAPGAFLPLPPPETEDVARVMAGAARRVMRQLEKRGLEGEDDPLAEDDPLLATLMAASIRSRIATGPEAGRPWRRLGDRVEPVDEGEGGSSGIDDTPPRCVRQGGMSMHADVSVPARDRRRLERLCRYVARPPLALERLEATPDGQLAYRLKTPWRDGTTHILMERREMLERLAPLIPPPRAHQVRYHGILAPSASGRDRIVPGAPSKPIAPTLGVQARDSTARPMSLTASIAAIRGAPTRNSPEMCLANSGRGPATPVAAQPRARALTSPHQAAPDVQEARPTRRGRRLSWSELLQRVFGIEALQCQCGKPMRVLAAITDPAVAQRILECVGLPPRAPPLEPASALEWAPAPWLAEHSSADFDQTPREDWDSGA